MKRFLCKAALLMCSGLLTAALAELALRAVGYTPLRLYQEQLKFWQYDPVLGWRLRPEQAGTFATQHFRIHVRNNRGGLRDRDYAYDPPPDARRVLVLGDSFVWGYGVEENERFTELLEKSGGGLEVINAGVSGYSTDQELIWFEREGVKYKPDLLVLGFCGNDERMNRERLVYDIYYKPFYALQGTNLVLGNVPVPKARLRTRLIYALKRRSALMRLLSDRWYVLSRARRSRAQSPPAAPSIPAAAPQPTESAAAPAEDYALTRALIRRLRDAAQAAGARCMILALPRWWMGDGAYGDFIARLRADGYPVLDVEHRPGFDPATMTIPGDGHWTQEGHRFVARELEGFIRDHALLAPPSAAR